MIQTTMNFKRGKKRYRFDVAHNLYDFGWSIDAALINWSGRTDDFSIESFCKYVLSKDPRYECMPAKEYKKKHKIK